MRWLPALAALLLAALVGADGLTTRPAASGGTGFRLPFDETLPSVNLTFPATGSVAELNVTATATATDVGTGVQSVRFTYSYCGASFATCGPETLVGEDITAPYSILWTFPSCVVSPLDKHRLWVRAYDYAGNVSAAAAADLALTGRGC